jgi:hypothetical protein
VFLDTTTREITVNLDDMTPLGSVSRFRLDPAQIDTLLFVVDRTNAAPGASGEFRVEHLRLER